MFSLTETLQTDLKEGENGFSNGHTGEHEDNEQDGEQDIHGMPRERPNAPTSELTKSQKRSESYVVLQCRRCRHLILAPIDSDTFSITNHTA